ncbi:hypothetical protein Mgra_00005040 [Meloidogyne graminicola]|uniref:Uncharacterized protein n=1 Tax=Meloidogyne graminicola TaxID=189291 RepID=A0A8S9ZQH6_9BILA|nr:hypothetical protein Mgra_00005040 [Meloidogyne graminicola]
MLLFKYLITSIFFFLFLYFLLSLNINMLTLAKDSSSLPLLLNNTEIPINNKIPKQQALLEHLFKHYRKELRPVFDERTVTEVAVQLYFKQIQKVKENDQIITVYCWLEEVYWNDEFLRWDPSNFGGIKQLHIPAEMIWRPDLLVYNNANMNIHESEMMTNALVQNDGRVSLFRAVITGISCHLNLHRFPFDQQICYLMLASWSYDGSQVMVHPASNDQNNEYSELNKNNNIQINLSSSSSSHHHHQQSTFTGLNNNYFMKSASLTHYIPNMEWRLIDFKTRSNLKWYDCCPNPYPDICYYFSIKRNPSYYLFTLIMPSALITTITVVGFFTTHSSTGENTEKVSLGVTSLLSLALILMMVSDKLPATSDTVPVLGQYYIGLICIQFTATYITTWTLHLQTSGNSGRALPRRLRHWLLGAYPKNENLIMRHLLGRELRTMQQSVRHRINRFDRVRVGLPLYNNDDSRFPFISSLNQRNGSVQQEVNTQLLSSESKYNSQKNCTVFNESSNKTLKNNLTQNGTTKQTEENSVKDSISNSLKEVSQTVQEIRLSLLTEEQLRQIRVEWQILARMIEKILKLVFSGFTIIFAVYMLYDEQAPPLITEEWIKENSH